MVKSAFMLLVILFFLWKTEEGYSQISRTERFSSQPEYTEEVAKKIAAISDFKILPGSKSLDTIRSIDNSVLKYFPPVLDQDGNSCSQASGIGYIFTYEMNLLRNSAANSIARIFSYHYTWNFLNGGTNSGSWYFDGYDIVMDNGVPSNAHMNDEVVSYKEWMDGYSRYYNAMKNRISGYSKILSNTDDGLNTIKQYLVDHGRGDEYGGLINFSAKVTGMDLEAYYGPNETNVSYIVRAFGNEGNHAMTFVGFDDTVELDLNNNGQIEQDEKGALILVNSWGDDWADFGKAYMPYKLLKTPIGAGGTGNSDKYVYVMDCYTHNPSVTAKLTLDHNSRNDLRIRIGVSNDPEATEPLVSTVKEIIKNQGGDHHMTGNEDAEGKRIDVGLDFSQLIEDIPDATRFFVTIYESYIGSEAGYGKMIRCSILDYREDYRNPKEYLCESSDIMLESKTDLLIDQVITTLPQRSVENLINLKIYPNPIHDRAQIDYSTKRGGEVKIDLLDITGKTLYTILKEKVEPGKSVVIWSRPHELPPGLYIFRFTDGKEGITRQIIFE